MNSDKNTKIERKPSVIESARGMALGTLSSRILGFVRDAVFFALFPRAFTDAFAVAFRLPNLFRRLLGEGSLSVSFVPIYISRKHSPVLADAVFSILLALTLTISFLAILFMDWIIQGLVGDLMGYGADAEKMRLTIALARIMMGYLVLVTLFAFYSAIANTKHFFFLPAAGPALFNVFIILFFLLAFYSSRELAAWGVIAGGVAQVLVVAGVLKRHRCLPRWTWRWRESGVGEMLRSMAPGLFGLGLFQVMTLVNTRFAASLEEGAQSYLYAADRILELPQSLIAVSLGSVLLPRFSEMITKGDRRALLEEATRSVRMLLFLSLPAAVGMRLLALPIVEVLFKRGEFSYTDAHWTAGVVEEYALLLIFAGLTRVTSPAFYAMKNTWLPALVAAAVLLIHILICPYFLAGWGVAGLAAATTVSSFVNFLLLQFLFHHYVGSLSWREILREVLRWLPALVLMAAAAVLLPMVLYPLGRTLMLFIVILFAVGIYFAVTYLSGSREARQFLRGFKGPARIKE